MEVVSGVNLSSLFQGLTHGVWIPCVVGLVVSQGHVEGEFMRQRCPLQHCQNTWG